MTPFEGITIVGNRENNPLQHIPTTSQTKGIPIPSASRYQRQELFFGQETQRSLRQTSIAIIGLGGLGSFVALELAHLGVGHLVLVDPDRVEETNLNRLLSVGNRDIGLRKVDAIATLMKRIAPHIIITTLPLTFLSQEAMSYVKGADIIVGCVDNDGTRSILNQLAVRYVIPYVDGATGIRLADNTRKLSVGGRVQVVLPGTKCLECAETINRVRTTMQLKSLQDRQWDQEHGYGTDEIAPSVISLNGVIASLQVTEILTLLTRQVGGKKLPALTLYNALTREVNPIPLEQSEDCFICGTDGLLAYGDLAPIRLADTVPTSTTPVALKTTEGEANTQADTREKA
jgi:molybdopterin/thiamine biosynthesis adenylyltransferase